MKLRKLLITVLLTFSFLTAVFVSVICTSVFMRQVDSGYKENLASAVQMEGESLNSYFNTRIQYIANLANNDSLKQFVVASNASGDPAAFGALQENLYGLYEGGNGLKGLTDNIFVTDRNGRVLLSASQANGELLPDMSLYSALQEGKVFVSPAFNRESVESRYFSLMYPIYQGGQYQGCVIQSFSAGDFSVIRNGSKIFNTGYLILLDQQGNFVATGDADNKAGSVDEAEFADLKNKISEIKARSEQTGYTEYSQNGKTRLSCYKMLDNGWILLSTIEKNEIFGAVIAVFENMLLLLLLIIVCVIIISVVVSKRVLNPLELFLKTIEKIRAGDYNTRFEYSKRNEFGQIATAFNNLIDTVNQKNQELAESEKRYRLAIASTSDLVFEIDIVEDKILSDLQELSEAYDLELSECYSKSIELIAQSRIFPDDIDHYLAAFSIGNLRRCFAKNKKKLYVEYRRLGPDKSYIWVSSSMIPVFDDKTASLRVIGYNKNIDKKKKKELEIINQAQKDSLTGFYNKGMTQKLVEDYLSMDGKEGVHALLIIDIDNFKLINDNLGHLFGDAVLSDISHKVQRIFRATDILGRIGGDEFAIFIKDSVSPKMIIEKALALDEVFRRSLTVENRNFEISASIGVAFYPNDGTGFTELYKNADDALYYAKKNGKGCYAFYNKKLAYNALQKSRPVYQNQWNCGSKLELKFFLNPVYETVFRILYTERDVRKAANILFKHMRQNYGISRAYMFEAAENAETISQTFEWCAPDIVPSMQVNQNIPLEKIGDYAANFDENGLLYTSEPSGFLAKYRCFKRSPDAESLLQLALFLDGRFGGFVGFDECSGERYWSKTDIRDLSSIAELIGSFVSKKHHSQLPDGLNLMQILLDSMNVCAFVIDQATHTVILHNTVEMDGKQLKPGDTCYSICMNNRNVHCKACPLAGLDSEHAQCSINLYDEKKDMWMYVTATQINWLENGKYILICCSNHKALEHPDI